MNCKDYRKALESSFDQGEVPGEAAQEHLKSCLACQAHQRELENIDAFLQMPAPVEAAGPLVARIQAAVAREPRPVTLSPWVGLAAAAAMVVLSLAGGWLIDTYGHVPYRALAHFRPSEPLMPDWEMLRAEIGAIPSELRLETTTTAARVGGFWQSGGAWIESVVSGNSAILWGGCLAGLVLVALVDGRELRRPV